MLKGSVCNIRHVTAADLPAYIALFNDLELRGEYVSTLFMSPEAMRREFAANGFVTEDKEAYLIEDKSGRIVGAIAHFKTRTPLGREIGYRLLDPALRGRGVMTEAVRMLCSYLFRAYQINRVELLMDPDNIGSERIAQKCGFTYEGTLRGAFFTFGAVRDTKIYGLLRSEWAAQTMPDVSGNADL